MKTEKTLFPVREIILCAVFAALIAVGAFIKIPIPVVPFTLQTLFVVLAGLLLGPKLGAASVAAYLILGLVGLPIFTQGGGPGYVLQPTFGYLVGFMGGAWLAGRIADAKKAPSYLRMLCAGLSALVVIYTIGVAYVALIKGVYLGTPMSLWNLILYCFLIFLPGDIASCAVAALIARRLSAALRRE